MIRSWPIIAMITLTGILLIRWVRDQKELKRALRYGIGKEGKCGVA
jgi:hypothetical protein